LRWEQSQNHQTGQAAKSAVYYLLDRTQTETMNILFALVICYIFGSTAWRTVLKKGAYPSSVKWYLKWFHALILCLLMMSALAALDELFWLVRHHSDVGSLSFLNLARVITIASGLALPFICDQMVKRRKQSLKWFFTIWPINVGSTLYVGLAPESGKYPKWSIEWVAAIACGIFLMTIIFYLSESVQRVLFDTGTGSVAQH
jgi:hypothetical protein